jgi:hypothetical protein
LVIGGARFKAVTEALVEILLFLITEDAAGKAREVVARPRKEAVYTRDVDDVCTDIEGKRERERFHDSSRVEGCAEIAAER